MLAILLLTAEDRRQAVETVTELTRAARCGLSILECEPSKIDQVTASTGARSESPEPTRREPGLPTVS
jgi:hypothetical protein